jgi:PTS system nitrogen regulatory IIA component
VKRIAGVFARLETPVDFESLDDQPVDLVFLLLAPEGAGPTISRPCRASRACCATPTRWPRSGARATSAIHALLSDTQASHAA